MTTIMLNTIGLVWTEKPKPKNKKQLQAEQRRRELEMANIAKELEEKKKKDEEKEQVRKEQERERKKMLEEESRKHEEDKKKQLNENRKKKERDEKEKEQRSQKEKEKNDRLKKNQEEEQRRKEEEKRRKAEEKAAKQKALKESREREEREKQEQLKLNTKNKARSQQYQQYQQQQQKYPREVPPRFLRQQQMKQQVPRKEQDYSSYNTDQYREETRWTAIVPDTQTEQTLNEDWDIDISDTPKDHSQNSSNYIENSWGGLPASDDWDLDNRMQTRSCVLPEPAPIAIPIVTPIAIPTVTPIVTPIATSIATIIATSIAAPAKQEQSPVVKSLFGPHDPPLSANTSVPPSIDTCSWGASLTGSTWDSNNASVRHWDSSMLAKKLSLEESVHPANLVNGHAGNNELSLDTQHLKTVQTISKPVPMNSANRSKPNHLDSVKTGSPGITPWAGLDDFDGGPTPVDSNTQQVTDSTYSGGAKPKTLPGDSHPSYHSFHSDNSDKARLQNTRVTKDDNTEKRVNVPSLDNKVDSNLKVTGWLQNATASEDWEEEEKESTDGDGWTTISTKTKKATAGGPPGSSAPGTPSKADGSNAWTNRALKQLLDMGFNREHAEKALRDNNGIIESAVSDLLMKGDCTEPIQIETPSDQKPSSTSKSETTSEPSMAVDSAVTPQKLNRKQRRKLQQMQMAEQAIEAPSIDTSVSSSVTNTASAPVIAKVQSEIPVKLKGDGLLPTPPASQRLIMTPETPATTLDKVISRPIGSKPVSTETTSQNAVQRPTSQPAPIGQSGVLDISTNAPYPPIGTRPNPPTPIQPPASIQHLNASSQSQSTTSTATDNVVEKMSGTTLQPPVNPVLLAQMHLKKLGLEDAPPASSYSSVPPVSSQAVTNTMIQRYLQQIAQATPEVETTPSVSASMHLSGLLQQAPVPASSLSEGPTKSKLLQWTQSTSACNSEPTTPPSDELKSIPQKVDPVSAKWGVIAAPRLSPTPAEFTPGVPWRSRDMVGDDKDDGLLSSKPVPREPISIPPNVPKPKPIKPPVNAMATEQTRPLIHQQSISSLQTQESNMGMRPPPGLMSTEVKPTPRVDDMCWLILKGMTSAVDPSTIRSVCMQFGTLLHFRVIGNVVYVRYETSQHSKNAWLQLNGRVMFNTQIIAEVSSEDGSMKAMEVAAIAANPPPVAALPMNNHVSQPQIPPGYQNVSSFGTLWATPGAVAAPTVQQPLFQQQTYPTYGVPTTTLSMNGGFNHWGIPGQPVMPSTSQLWGPAPPQQTSTMYQPYPGWLTAKPEVPIQANVFSPGMDRCLPSELFNVKEQGS